MKGMWFIVAVAMVFTVTRYAPAKAASQPTLDEAQPTDIPADVVADWKAQGRTDLAAAHKQRVAALKESWDYVSKVVYCDHFNVGGTIYGYTEDLNSDGAGNIGGKFAGIAGMSKGSKYKAGAEIYLLEFKNAYPSPTKLIADTKGVLRDPCVWFKGDKMVFAWAKTNNGYNLYEMEVKPDATPRQITSNPASHAVSDFEPCYTPDGNIVFMSSRCFSHVDCNFNLVSNIYLCNKDGKYIRRISYDQVNIFRPTCTDQGLICYGRWEYNDRNVMDGFGVFTMYPSGEHQTELWGNQIGTPAGKPCATVLPGGKGKVVFTTAVHMSSVYQGDLVIADINKGRNTKAAVTYVGKTGSPGSGLSDGDKKYSYPIGVSENHILVAYSTSGSGLSGMFDLFLMNVTTGARELLAKSTRGVCQPTPAGVREIPPKIVSSIDYTKTTATASITNVYTGNGTSTSGIAAGSVKKVRAIALNYRVHPWVGNTGSSAYTATPVARYNGSWESKRVLGEMNVESDGSAAMILPARTPIYFQLIGADGCLIQSMRSWTTLMPNEKFDCAGCHEDKNASLPVGNPIAKTPKELQAFYGMKDFYFYYPKILQEGIIEKKCISCHKTQAPVMDGTKIFTGDLSDADNSPAERYWCKSYLNLSTSKYVKYIDIFSPASGLRPNSTGSGKSALITKLKNPGTGMKDAGITQEDIDKFAMWVDLCIPHSGDYTDDMSDANKTKYLARLKIRQDLEAQEKKDLDACVAAHDVSCFPTGAVNPNGVIDVKKSTMNAGFDVQCLANGKKLVLRLPGEGKILLMDVLGRQIMNRTTGKNAANSEMTIRTNLSKGIYIVKFKSAAATGYKVLNVL